jgi:type I restriction enzyme S subunit
VNKLKKHKEKEKPTTNSKRKDWFISSIGEECKVVNGGTPKTSFPAYWDGEIRWITPAEMGKRDTPFISETRRTITQEGVRDSSATLLPPYSVILSSRAPIGYLLINTEPMATNQGCKGLVPKERLSYKYLYYYLLSIEGLLNKLGSGTTFKELSGGKLKEVQIPVPPMHDQERIVAILDEAFEGMARTKSNSEQNLSNAQSIFDDSVKVLITSEELDWPILTLGEICQVERGSSPRPIKNYFTTEPDGVNWIKIGDTVVGEKYIYSTNQRITPEGAKQSRFVQEGDFVLTNSMSFGRSYIMKTSGYIHDGWFVLRLKSSIDRDYLYYLLSSKYIRDQFKALASGSVVLNISGDLVKRARLPIPPIKEQSDLVSRLNTIAAETKSLQATYERKIKALDALRQSLLSAAFSGNL